MPILQIDRMEFTVFYLVNSGRVNRYCTRSFVYLRARTTHGLLCCESSVTCLQTPNIDSTTCACAVRVRLRSAGSLTWPALAFLSMTHLTAGPSFCSSNNCSTGWTGTGQARWTLTTSRRRSSTTTQCTLIPDARCGSH